MECFNKECYESAVVGEDVAGVVEVAVVVWEACGGGGGGGVAEIVAVTGVGVGIAVAE